MTGADDELSLVFHALADPTRRAILSRLHGGPTTVGELAEPFAMSRPAISQHLKVLERAGLIERTTTAQWRTCTLRTEPLDEASEWVERHRGEWNERFDLLDEHLCRMKGTS
ncbi:ArsR/SmtB family transcription factor [Agromyces bauzanensis]|uniref:Transcriptional regulator n=1 Tax=Agromyces bauzanensis TaxID=1308924 RepID=A0A917PK00_9MICO|nr:metalloregulator ArsR/SmtB family transcription factor [Agromyces bauzanensis]GGJ81197.1 transcriptional regulator [Agromyces bauzanensis]